jgi:prepilin-type N-terminal cleavage/methylation domain-containing protein
MSETKQSDPDCGNGPLPRREREQPPGGREGDMRIQDEPRGFSLIELLVVIATVALLLSLLLPAVSRARQSAKQTVCISNLRQIGLAIDLYAQTHRGEWPRYVVDSVDVDNGHWSTPKLYGPDPVPRLRFVGLGQMIPGELRDLYVLLCPSESRDLLLDPLKFQWDNPGPAAAWSSYVLRGWSQTYAADDRYPGRKLTACTNRALVSCFFLGKPNEVGNPLHLHPQPVYPVLFGAGDVELGRLPKSLVISPTPDIWDSTPLQYRVWDSFDLARSGGRAE